LNADPVNEAGGDDDKKPAGKLEDCLMVGTITKVKNGSVTVAVPGVKAALTFKFAEGAVITVSGNNLSVARIGDKVTAQGSLYAPGVMASQEIKVEHTPAMPEEKPLRTRPKPEDVAKPGDKNKPMEKENPFALDPDDKKPDPAVAKKPKVKLELIKIN
jgi:hypothetical protein